MMCTDEKWMQIAIQEAIKARNAGEVPIGAVIIKDGILLSKGHNSPISSNDSTAHAEIQAIRHAGKKLKNYRLSGTSLYVTLEPCSMCIGAIMHARIKRVIFGAYDNKIDSTHKSANIKNFQNFNHKIIVTHGILEDHCRQLLDSFFTLKRLNKSSLISK